MLNTKVFSVNAVVRKGAIETLAQHADPALMHRSHVLLFVATTSKKRALELMRKAGAEFLVLDVKVNDWRASSLAGNRGLHFTEQVHASTFHGSNDTPVIAINGHNGELVQPLSATTEV